MVILNTALANVKSQAQRHNNIRFYNQRMEIIDLNNSSLTLLKFVVDSVGKLPFNKGIKVCS